MTTQAAWTDTQVDFVRGMAAEGMSSTQMASRCQTTRNAIIGICRRKGIMLTGNGGRPHVMPPNLPRLRPQVRVNAPGIYRGYVQKIQDAGLLTPKQSCKRERPHVPPDPAAKCNIFELNRGTCHFPLWGNALPKFSEQFYCGSPVLADKPYCYVHQKETTRQLGAPFSKQPKA